METETGRWYHCLTYERMIPSRYRMAVLLYPPSTRSYSCLGTACSVNSHLLTWLQRSCADLFAPILQLSGYHLDSGPRIGPRTNARTKVCGCVPLSQPRNHYQVAATTSKEGSRRANYPLGPYNTCVYGNFQHPFTDKLLWGWTCACAPSMDSRCNYLSKSSPHAKSHT